MEKKRLGNVVLEDAQIRFRNFAGKGGKYNAEGKRNFCVLLPDLMAEQMADDGWNVKYLNPRDEDEKPQPYIQVNVNFEGFQPPKIFIITSHGKTQLDEDSVDALDWAEIEKVDLIINPYIWDVGDKTGVKGYLKSMYVTIVEDELEKKYGGFPGEGPEELPFE